MLDDIHSNDPKDYNAGFPWHPHRGMETITYVLEGNVRHEDNLGSVGIIGRGDVQWMTAGSGIIHQEMPNQTSGALWGLQLWTNLPAAQKMTTPRYQDIRSKIIPEITLESNIRVRIIAGRLNDTVGPVTDINIDPNYFDISMKQYSEMTFPINTNHNVFAYVLDGEAQFSPDSEILADSESLVLFTAGDTITVSTKEKTARFLLISGNPLKEPICWYGPIVMNTKNEILTAFKELEAGVFIKHHS